MLPFVVCCFVCCSLFVVRCVLLVGCLLFVVLCSL